MTVFRRDNKSPNHFGIDIVPAELIQLRYSASSPACPSPLAPARCPRCIQRGYVSVIRQTGIDEVWRANIDGSEPKQLTTCGKNFQPNATPDGKWVVYRSSCDSTGALWRVSIDGGQPIRLTERSGSWPWVSPDSKWIAREYSSAGKIQLAIIPIEGGSPAKGFDVPPQANFRFGIRWTTDGKAVTYRDWGKGLWRQSIEGGAPQRIPGLPDEKIYSNGWSRDGKLFAFTRGVEIRDVVLISNSK